ESVDLTKDLTLPAAALEQIGDSGQVAITGQIDFELAASWRWLAVEARRASSFTTHPMSVQLAK
ncbi:MAG: hypothetical protein Q8P31_05870, partial [Bacillota bacterium]|nr:hypothetical protein [Bacillota bacterium]